MGFVKKVSEFSVFLLASWLLLFYRWTVQICRNNLTMRKITIILSVLMLVLSGCGQTTKKQTETIDIQDTIIVKQRNLFNQSWQTDFYSKSYSYYWLVGKDTLDFKIDITEYKRDTTCSLHVFHKEPILFTVVLAKVEECFTLIEEDFNLSKLTSFGFMPPVFYLDLAKKLSSEYEQEFGRKNISYDKLDQFLLKSSLNTQLNHFFIPLNKKVRRYGLEKFHLIDKENYKEYLPNVDFTEYPEFTLNAHIGIFVSLENE